MKRTTTVLSYSFACLLALSSLVSAEGHLSPTPSASSTPSISTSPTPTPTTTSTPAPTSSPQEEVAACVDNSSPTAAEFALSMFDDEAAQNSDCYVYSDADITCEVCAKGTPSSGCCQYNQKNGAHFKFTTKNDCTKNLKGSIGRQDEKECKKAQLRADFDRVRAGVGKIVGDVNTAVGIAKDAKNKVKEGFRPRLPF